MTDEARAAQAAYKRAWRKKNKDKVKAQNQRYWEKKAAQMKEEDKAVINGGGEEDATAETITGG